ncbi:LAME_0E02366g1_1 [Lachancea meyersii CBS 8951]|uniref:LAME_0E02366g1_1 n=1 Tax=Lachancea meyersii CBS 8951 TaxID=1266667 RepID=A0A1G4JFS7_9SACH|nr:LAME_0E02366g1_1 [Lachancea meyersii CBS 8951]
MTSFQASTSKADGGKKGLQSSIWATTDNETAVEEKTVKKSSGRRRNSKNGRSNSQNVSEKTNNVNALAARLGMVDLKSEPERRAPKSKKTIPPKDQARSDSSAREREHKHSKSETSVAGQRKTANPLAMRLGIVDVGEVGEVSEDNESDEPSRPSTSDRRSIFDRIKPKPQVSPEPKKPAKTSVSPAPKTSEILKRRIEEQKKIREAQLRKAQQINLLQDFLKDDEDTGWEEDL